MRPGFWSFKTFTETPDSSSRQNWCLKTFLYHIWKFQIFENDKLLQIELEVLAAVASAIT